MAVYALTNDEKRATHSLRISISHMTTKEEAKAFINEFNELVRRNIWK